MPLPKIEHPTKKIIVPSTQEEIFVRPFTVKEEKIALMAKESKDAFDKVNAVSQIVKNCIVSEDFDFTKCASFDAEYIYLHIMGFSVQNVFQMKFIDENEKEIPFAVNVDEVEVVFPKEKMNFDVNLNDNLGIRMRYLTFFDIEELSKTNFKDAYEESFESVKKSIEFIYDQEQIYKDFSDKELEDFINSLDPESFSKIMEFYQNSPHLYYKTEIEDSNGKKHTIELKDLSDFFT